MKPVLCLFVGVLCVAFSARAQDSSRFNRLLSLPDKLFGTIDKKSRSVEEKLTRSTDHYLSKLQRQEEKLRRKIARKDPQLAHDLFPNIDSSYQALRSSSAMVSRYSSVYSSHLDSMQTALRFLQGSTTSAFSSGNLSPQLQHNLESYKALQSRLNASEQIRRQLLQRQQELRQQLSRLGMLKELKAFRKQVHYYQAQLREYKTLWEDPQKLEQKLLTVVRELPVFKDFFRQHSDLSRLFALPGSSASSSFGGGQAGASASLAGLQTRASVNQTLVNRFGSSPQVTQALQQNVQSAQGQLNQLKQQLLKYTSGHFGNTTQDPSLPNFRPNAEKTKSLKDRLELGFNLQSQKARYGFPATTDLGLSLGYRLHQNAVMGVGLSYKLGLGRGWDHLRLTHQGLGLRSYADLKLKGSIYATAGYERNYWSEIRHLAQLKDRSAWQQSGLIGVSKRYKAGGKLKGEVKLLWDFLSYQQVPRAQPIVFRISYRFR